MYTLIFSPTFPRPELCLNPDKSPSHRRGGGGLISTAKRYIGDKGRTFPLLAVFPPTSILSKHFSPALRRRILSSDIGAQVRGKCPWGSNYGVVRNTSWNHLCIPFGPYTCFVIPSDLGVDTFWVCSIMTLFSIQCSDFSVADMNMALMAMHCFCIQYVLEQQFQGSSRRREECLSFCF